MLIDVLRSYLTHHTYRLLCRIRYTESCFRTKLLRLHHSHSSKVKTTIDVYPQVIIDTPKVLLNRQQLDYLSHTGKSNVVFDTTDTCINLNFLHSGPNYIRPNQSYLHSRQQREKQVKKQHQNLMDVIIPYLVRVHHIPQTSTIIKHFSQQLETYLHERYMAPLSYLRVYRTRQELKLIKSIRYRLKKGKHILRVTDKSGIFHIGHAKDYEHKAEAYQQKTQAYMQLESDPLWSVFDKVVQLLNNLRAKKHIMAWQLNQMMPKKEETELAHLYFIPKPHKVISEAFLSVVHHCDSSCLVEHRKAHR